jgi:hypothetical protein
MHRRAKEDPSSSSNQAAGKHPPKMLPRPLTTAFLEFNNSGGPGDPGKIKLKIKK